MICLGLSRFLPTRHYMAPLQVEELSPNPLPGARMFRRNRVGESQKFHIGPILLTFLTMYNRHNPNKNLKAFSIGKRF